MPFASGLRRSLETRGDLAPSEFRRGDSLEEVLDRHLLAVEEMAEGYLLTSILLLSDDGKRLSHGAGPNLPRSYRESIDGLEIGPSAGSCGTAAYFGSPIYVDDIAVDPLWTDYRELALQHGLRSCWSTPIRGDDDGVIGTFAIYHRQVGSPTREELDAIEMITQSVADAITWARSSGDLEPRGMDAALQAPRLRLVSSNPEPIDTTERLAGLLSKIARLESIAAELTQEAGAESDEWRERMETLADDSRKLAEVIQSHIERLKGLPTD